MKPRGREPADADLDAHLRMPKLEIRTPDGRTELRKLSRRNPIVVGRNPISDVRVDDDSVSPIHCRVSWNGKAFEVAAVAGDGVDVNGVLVRRKELTAGDVIRVGEIDLVMLNGSGEAVKAAAAVGGETRKPSRTPEARPRAVKPPAEDAPAELVADEWAALSAGEIAAVAPPAAEPPSRTPSEKPEPRHEEIPADEPVLLDEVPVPPQRKAEEPPAKRPPAPPIGALGRLRQTKRPGEQEILSSPMVLGFGGVALVLLLAAGAIWLLIGREGADRLYAAAVSDRDAGRYAQAVRNYEQFLLEYPGDGRTRDARYALGLTRIERHAGGSSPDFSRALVAFDEFVRTNRDRRDFDSQRGPLRTLAARIASGASVAATRTGDRKHLTPAEEARRLFDRYAPSDASVDPERSRLAREFATAEAAVRKREYFDVAAAKIEAAVAADDLPTAFETRADLLTRYPDLRTDRRVRALLAKTLEAERGLVKSIDPASGGHQPPPHYARRQATRGADAPRSPLTLIGHAQARAGEVSDGRLVFAVARDALFSLDAVTGRPRWRASLGLDTPFFPIEVDTSVPALLAFDASQDELVLFRRSDGEPLWRTPVGAAAAGPPLIAQGQVDLATADGRLVRFALESGEPLAAVAFPQPVVGPPVLAGTGERLILFGDRATAYTLDLRTLAVEAVSFTGQAAGAVDVAPQALGGLVVVCENDRLEEAVVRAFAVDPESGVLRQVAAERVPGQVRQPPMARGNVLFVPSSPERVTVFSVSDGVGQQPLTRLAGIQIPDPKEVPTYLVPGPDGMLWAAGSALRKLRLAADGLELLPGSLAPGRHTQPPQESGESLFVARSLASAPAVYVSQADREAMTGSWRTVLGAAIVAFASNGDRATAVTEAGQVAVLSPRDFDEGGFLDAVPLPQWDEASPEMLQGTAFADGRAAVWRGGKAPLLWLASAGDAPRPPLALSAVPECPPVALDGGIVLPLPGRLEWLPVAGGSPVEAFLLPVGGEGQVVPKWRFLVRLDGDQLAAADDAGLLRVIRVRREPLLHLAEVAAVTLETPLSRPPVAVGERLVVASDRGVQLLDPAGLRPIAETTFDVPVSGGPWSVEDLVFVEVGSADVIALHGESLKELWRRSLDAPAAGSPVRAHDGWVVASQTGAVVVAGDDGGEVARFHFAAALTNLHLIGTTVVAAALDGSLYPIPTGPGNAAEAEDAGEAPRRSGPEPAGTPEEPAE